MSKHEKSSKHLGKAEAKRHDRTHSRDKENVHKLGIAMTLNKYNRDHPRPVL